jgi:hypothetical protein
MSAKDERGSRSQADLAHPGRPGYSPTGMATLDDDIAFFETQRAHLEAHCMGKWVLVHDVQIVGLYNTFEEAATQAVTKFGAGPYLIRQVGAQPVVLPASAMFNVAHG